MKHSLSSGCSTFGGGWQGQQQAGSGGSISWRSWGGADIAPAENAATTTTTADADAAAAAAVTPTKSSDAASGSLSGAVVLLLCGRMWWVLLAETRVTLLPVTSIRVPRLQAA